MGNARLSGRDKGTDRATQRQVRRGHMRHRPHGNETAQTCGRPNRHEATTTASPARIRSDALSRRTLAMPTLASTDGTVRWCRRWTRTRYAGLWYEVARYPNQFQKSCEGRDGQRNIRSGQDGASVVNACQRDDGSDPQKASRVRRRVGRTRSSRCASPIMAVVRSRGVGRLLA